MQLNKLSNKLVDGLVLLLAVIVIAFGLGCDTGGGGGGGSSGEDAATPITPSIKGIAADDVISGGAISVSSISTVKEINLSPVLTSTDGSYTVELNLLNLSDNDIFLVTVTPKGSQYPLRSIITGVNKSELSQLASQGSSYSGDDTMVTHYSEAVVELIEGINGKDIFLLDPVQLRETVKNLTPEVKVGKDGRVSFKSTNLKEDEVSNDPIEILAQIIQRAFQRGENIKKIAKAMIADMLDDGIINDEDNLNKLDELGLSDFKNVEVDEGILEQLKNITENAGNYVALALYYINEAMPSETFEGAKVDIDNAYSTLLLASPGDQRATTLFAMVSLLKFAEYNNTISDIQTYIDENPGLSSRAIMDNFGLNISDIQDILIDEFQGDVDGLDPAIGKLSEVTDETISFLFSIGGKSVEIDYADVKLAEFSLQLIKSLVNFAAVYNLDGIEDIENGDSTIEEILTANPDLLKLRNLTGEPYLTNSKNAFSVAIDAYKAWFDAIEAETDSQADDLFYFGTIGEEKQAKYMKETLEDIQTSLEGYTQVSQYLVRDELLGITPDPYGFLYRTYSVSVDEETTPINLNAYFLDPIDRDDLPVFDGDVAEWNDGNTLLNNKIKGIFPDAVLKDKDGDANGYYDNIDVNAGWVPAEVGVETFFYTEEDPVAKIFTVPSVTINVDGNSSDWTNIPTLIEDPKDVLEAPGIDLRKVKIAKDNSKLYLLIEMEGDLDVSYSDILLDFGKESGGNLERSFCVHIYSYGSSDQGLRINDDKINDAIVNIDGKVIEVSIPFEQLPEEFPLFIYWVFSSALDPRDNWSAWEEICLDYGYRLE